MTDEQMIEISMRARAHASALRDDIQNAQTRIEHIRLTALAVEADHIAHYLEIMAARPEIDTHAETV